MNLDCCMNYYGRSKVITKYTRWCCYSHLSIFCCLNAWMSGSPLTRKTLSREMPTRWMPRLTTAVDAEAGSSLFRRNPDKFMCRLITVDETLTVQRGSSRNSGFLYVKRVEAEFDVLGKGRTINRGYYALFYQRRSEKGITTNWLRRK